MFWEEICAIKESLALQDNLAPKMYLVYKIDLKTFKIVDFGYLFAFFAPMGIKAQTLYTELLYKKINAIEIDLSL